MSETFVLQRLGAPTPALDALLTGHPRTTSTHAAPQQAEAG